MSPQSTQSPQPTYAAVGVPVGISPQSDPDFGREAFFLTIRAGSRFVALDVSSASAWIRAATPANLNDLALAAGDEEAAAELISAGLLVRMPDAEGSAASDEPFFQLVPIPLTRVVSADSRDGGSWTIADWSGELRAQLHQLDYHVWSYLNGRTSIVDALRRANAALHIDLDSLTSRAPGLFMALVTSRSIVLDAP